jgi:hypothetical protein
MKHREPAVRIQILQLGFDEPVIDFDLHQFADGDDLLCLHAS